MLIDETTWNVNGSRLRQLEENTQLLSRSTKTIGKLRAENLLLKQERKATGEALQKLKQHAQIKGCYDRTYGVVMAINTIIKERLI